MNFFECLHWCEYYTPNGIQAVKTEWRSHLLVPLASNEYDFIFLLTKIDYFTGTV